MVATPETEDDHVTAWLISCVLPSLKVPIALYCRVPPGGMKLSAGFTAIETRLPEVTVSGAEPTIDPRNAELVAVIVVVPAAWPVALFPFIVATAGTLENQVT